MSDAKDETLNEFTIKDKIIVFDEFKNLIPRLTDEEYTQLEQNILAEGVRDPIVIWKTEDKLVLADGHNRFAICMLHNLGIPFIFKNFSNSFEVKTWMINQQIGRRNLTPQKLSYFRGQCYQLKKAQGVEEDGWLKRLADQFSVSKRTIMRDGLFAKNLNDNPEKKSQILSGKLKVPKSSILKSNEPNTSVKPQIKSDTNDSTSMTHSGFEVASIAYSYLVNEKRPFHEVANEIHLIQTQNTIKNDKTYELNYFLTWEKYIKGKNNSEGITSSFDKT